MSVRFPSELYFKYRPTYPSALYQVIGEWMEKAQVQKPAVIADIGCGSGQATIGFVQSSLARKIIAIEKDPEMLEAAKRRKEFKNFDVEFLARPGEDTLLQSGSVDVILCASAFHWMSRDLAVREFERIIKNPGLICMAEYSFPVSEALDEFNVWIRNQLLGPWEIPELRDRTPFFQRVMVFSEQGGARLIELREIPMVREMNWQEMVGLIQTQSRYVRYRDSMTSDEERISFDREVMNQVRGLLGDKKWQFDFKLLAAGFGYGT